MGYVKQHGIVNMLNSRSISMRKLYKKGNDNTPELWVRFLEG